MTYGGPQGKRGQTGAWLMPGLLAHSALLLASAGLPEHIVQHTGQMWEKRVERQPNVEVFCVDVLLS